MLVAANVLLTPGCGDTPPSGAVAGGSTGQGAAESVNSRSTVGPESGPVVTPGDPLAGGATTGGATTSGAMADGAMTSGGMTGGGDGRQRVPDGASPVSMEFDAGATDRGIDAPGPALSGVDAGTGDTGPAGGAMDQDAPSAAASPYACDGPVEQYAATVISEGGTWTVRRDGTVVTTTSSMLDAMQAGMDSLSPGRRSKQAVLVQGSGTIDANARSNIPDYTILNVCGTIDVTGNNTQSDRAPIYARGRNDIEIPNISITGSPGYAMFFRDVDNLTLGKVDLRLSDGEGIRIDNHGRADRSAKVRNITIDHVYVSGTGHHGVETYGVDNIKIGTVVARDTTNCGLLLNDTTNAEVGLVDGEDVATGNGYAVFRLANRAGRINGSYPTNIHVGEVRARRGGRGIFCVSASGGAVIDRVDIANTGNHAILVENCYNVTIASESGTVAGPGRIRIAARSEFPTTSDVTFSNLLLNDTAITENPCGSNNRALDITPMSAVDMCD